MIVELIRREPFKSYFTVCVLWCYYYCTSLQCLILLPRHKPHAQFYHIGCRILSYLTLVAVLIALRDILQHTHTFAQLLAQMQCNSAPSGFDNSMTIPFWLLMLLLLLLYVYMLHLDVSLNCSLQNILSDRGQMATDANIQSYLLCPVQRICKYPLLFRVSIVKLRVFLQQQSSLTLADLQ